jgi:copper chaperone
METLKFKTNINCNGCVNAVTPFMAKSKGIVKWKVDTDSSDKVLTVEVQDMNAGDVEQVVKSAGFQAEPIN